MPGKSNRYSLQDGSLLLTVLRLCVCVCVSSVILAVEQAAMEKSTERRAVFHGLSKQIHAYRFVVMTHLLADSVGILALLSRSLQCAGITYCEAQHFVETAILSIRSLVHTRALYETGSCKTALKSRWFRMFHI